MFMCVHTCGRYTYTMRAWMSINTHTWHANLHVYGNVCPRVRLCSDSSIWCMRMFVHARMHTPFLLRVCMRACICACVWVRACVYLTVSGFMRVCVCVCVRACARVRGSTWLSIPINTHLVSTSYWLLPTEVDVWRKRIVKTPSFFLFGKIQGDQRYDIPSVRPYLLHPFLRSAKLSYSFGNRSACVHKLHTVSGCFDMPTVNYKANTITYVSPLRV